MTREIESSDESIKTGTYMAGEPEPVCELHLSTTQIQNMESGHVEK